MEWIVIKLSRQVKRHFHRTIKKIKDAGLKTRYLIISHTAEGYSRHTVAEMLLCSTPTVDRVRKRFAEEGVSGLIDRRGDNSPARMRKAIMRIKTQMDVFERRTCEVVSQSRMTQRYKTKQMGL